LTFLRGKEAGFDNPSSHLTPKGVYIKVAGDLQGEVIVGNDRARAD
jgi:hypothetical protein